MSHDYHESLSGYDPEQILHDGCRECEARSKGKDHGISNLDSGNFTRALIRARRWNTTGVTHVSFAEVPLLSVLSAVQAQLSRVGVSLYPVEDGDS